MAVKESGLYYPNKMGYIYVKNIEGTIGPEAVKAGAVRIVGTDTRRIVDAAAELLGSRAAYESMVVRKNPYGDGRASERIIREVRKFLEGGKGS